MFFRMLKKDLLQKKGLNFILFLFITVAAAMVYIGAIQIYSGIVAAKHTAKVCNLSEMQIIFDSGTNNCSENAMDIINLIKDTGYSGDIYTSEMLNAESINFNDFDESESRSFSNNRNFLITMPKKVNLLYDLEDNTFFVRNGTIAIPARAMNLTGAKVGDKVRFTTDQGNVYEFEIATFFKDTLSSSRSYYRYVISDSDYKLLAKENSTIFISFDASEKEFDYDNYLLRFVDHFYESDLEGTDIIRVHTGQNEDLSDSKVFNYIIVVFVVLISIFMILIVLMTIRFTMVATLKEEEKEIGVMKAIGADSLSYRWIFCAKYIAFTVAGGIIGVVIGFPLSKYMLSLFFTDYVTPSFIVTTLIGIIAVMVIIIFIILFSLMVMRRINKISVIDAIYGENHGERFKKNSALFLHKRKRMPGAFYLALSDVLTRMKRYIFLIIVYVLSATMMLMIFNLKSTVISEGYYNYWMIYNVDFGIDLQNQEELMKRVGGEKSIYDVVNEEIKKNHILAELVTSDLTFGNYMIGEDEIEYILLYGCDEIDQLNYCKGGTAPKLENEIAISNYSATKYGLQLGDIVEFELKEYDDDGLGTKLVRKEFVITGFLNVMESGTPRACLSSTYKNAYPHSQALLAYNINAEGEEKEKTFQKLEEVFGEQNIMESDELIKRSLTEYDRIFTLLEYIIGSAVIFISMLITYLCSSVFIAEETPEIALMKSLGIQSLTIKAQYVLRFLILLAFSIPVSVLLLKSAIELLAKKLFEYLEISGFAFLPEYIGTFIVIPFIMVSSIMIVTLFKIRSIKNIEIWKISEE